MEFNIDKCKVMHIGSSNKNFRYYVENQELEVVQEEKYLKSVDHKRLESFKPVLIK